MKEKMRDWVNENESKQENLNKTNIWFQFALE